MLVLEELQRVDAAFSHLLAQKFSVSYPFFLNLKVVDYFNDKLYSVLKMRFLHIISSPAKVSVLLCCTEFRV